MTTADQTASLIAQRLEDGMRVLDSLLATKPLPFDDQLSGSLPKQHGIYAISVRGAQPGDMLRAGRTTTAAEGLHQRVYRNHFMGNQKGNLLSQLCITGENEQPFWSMANGNFDTAELTLASPGYSRTSGLVLATYAPG